MGIVNPVTQISPVESTTMPVVYEPQEPLRYVEYSSFDPSALSFVTY
jgi:hypothetical protein